MKNLMLLFFLLPIWMTAQVSSFSVEVDRDSVLFGNTIKVTYVLKNVDGKFEAPAFSDFSLISGPNTSSSMYSINGNTTKTTTYTYFIKPLKEGQCFIEEAYLIHRTDEEKNMTADAIKIKVMPNPEGIIEDAPQGNSQQLFFSWPMETDQGAPIEKEAPSKPKRKVKRI
ncbi:MAG: BatD family protein [Saprospiraceae bacterium]|nr:BatD family protein [Saprospiraceae bacterium]MBK8112002.1 BatD family protein [Saprospiraceae bacterium]MBK8850354.1 BatD family protein [Saprospiraceae bacterium]